jgi:hypothetical protein
MRPIWRTLMCALGAGGLVLGALASSTGVANASPDHSRTTTCNGTQAAPGELAGTYQNLVIAGECAVQNGPVIVRGNLTVAPNAALNAVFGLNNSNLTVDGNMYVQKNASVMIGCDTVSVTLWGTTGTFLTPEFPCIDDPNGATAPTLSSHDVIRGNLIAIDTLGVVLHNTAVDGNVYENGGGGGNNCTNQGIFNQDIGFPQYSGYFDSSVRGNITVTNLTTCWYGIFRVDVGGNMTNNNIVNNDPDGNEDQTNVIQGNLVCLNDSPAVQWGDGNGEPNEVGGRAVGQCGFNVEVPNPAPEAGVVGVTPVLVHVSVPLHPKH